LIATEKQVMTNEQLHKRLRVSLSYLKKINRKLVVGGLITSSYGANGGFNLARDMKNITLYDLVDAIDGNEPYFKTTGLLENVFPKKTHEVEIGKGILSRAFIEAQLKMNKQLKKTTMAQILKEAKEPSRVEN
jgi:Rrf2 family transcriptional regulator, iron-sulfur cluster assembly transcription factor